MTDPYFATVRQAIKSRGFVAGPDRGPKFRFQCFQPFAPRAKRMTNEPSILVSEVALGNSRWIWLLSHAPAILQLLGSRVIA